MLFTTSNRTHKSVHTSFFKSSWNLAKEFDLQFKDQSNHLRDCGSSWDGRGGGRGGNVAVMGAVGVPYCKTMYHHVNYKPELLHVLVTFVRGPLVSSTRLIRKVSQFRVPSLYVVPTAHGVCVQANTCVQHMKQVCSTSHSMGIV